MTSTTDLAWLTTAYTLPRSLVTGSQATLIVKTGSVAVTALIASDEVTLTDLATTAGGITKIDLTAMPDLKFTPSSAEFIVIS